jgi:hypothetical protein
MDAQLTDLVPFFPAPPSGLHFPFFPFVGVDEIGQRGWRALHKAPRGIAEFE